MWRTLGRGVRFICRHPMTSKTSDLQNKQALHRLMWRWHFYAGLFCIPFMITLSVSGAIYLFKPQIQHWVDEPYHQLDVLPQRSSPEAQIQAALEVLPNSELVSYRLPQQSNHAVKIKLRHKGERHLVYVNPYTLEVLKQLPYDQQFIRQVRRFHGELMVGDTGSIFVELAACWSIVLILTGIYLAWPRSVSGLGGVLYPRLSLMLRKSAGASRILWREIHAVTGMWIAIFALFLIISGLPWALVWGSAFKEVKHWLNGSTESSWSVRHHSSSHQQPLDRPELTTQVLDMVASQAIAPPVDLSVATLSHGEMGWKANSRHQNRPLRSDIWLTPEAHIVKQWNFSDRSTIDQVVGIGIAAHEGHLFGWLNQLLGVLVTLGLVLMSISGFVLWWKRKPQGKLGAPKAMPSMHASRVVGVSLLMLAAVLPLLALSLLIIVLLEYGVLPAIQRLNRPQAI